MGREQTASRGRKGIGCSPLYSEWTYQYTIYQAEARASHRRAPPRSRQSHSYLAYAKIRNMGKSIFVCVPAAESRPVLELRARTTMLAES
jgi:hypothetical protein